MAIYVEIGSGGVVASGLSLSSQHFGQLASSGAIVSGISTVNHAFTESANGGIVVSGTGTDVLLYNFNLPINWNINEIVNFSLPIKWNVGQLPYRWYRVMGKCKYIGTNNAYGGASGCSTTGVQTDDPTCNSANSKQLIIVNLAARTIQEVCSQLTEMKMKWEIASLKIWSRPVFNDALSANINCNTLSEVPFSEISQISDCLRHILNTDALTKISAKTSITDFHINYEGSATVNTVVSSLVTSTNPPTQSLYIYISDGAVVNTDGSATVSSSNDIQEYVTQINCSTSLSYQKPLLRYLPSGPNTILQPNQVVNANCGSCNAMPKMIYVYHNLGNGSVLSTFLNRSGLILPNPVRIVYNSSNKSWTGSVHLKGSSDDNIVGNTELWNISFDLGCSSIVDGQEYGSTYFGFSMTVSRKNSVKNITSNTKVYFIFPSSEFCAAIKNLTVDFSYIINTTNSVVGNSLNIQPNIDVFYDNIGIFKSDYWSLYPNFTMLLSRKSQIRNYSISQQTVNY